MLTEKKVSYYIGHWDCGAPFSRPSANGLINIARTCRPLSQVALEVFRNAMHLTLGLHDQNFEKMMYEVQLDLSRRYMGNFIRNITLRNFKFPTINYSLEVLQQFPNLRTLCLYEIEIERGDRYAGSNDPPLWKRDSWWWRRRSIPSIPKLRLAVHEKQELTEQQEQFVLQVIWEAIDEESEDVAGKSSSSPRAPRVHICRIQGYEIIHEHLKLAKKSNYTLLLAVRVVLPYVGKTGSATNGKHQVWGNVIVVSSLVPAISINKC